jgi:hypothetical protein
MRNVHRWAWVVLTMLGITLTTVSSAPVAEPAKAERPVVQIAILLDTSGSMDGLIAQAKQQLWKIVNEFSAAKRNGQVPQLQVALYEYGKQSLPAGEGYLRQILPLTTDLDKVSEELFILKTNGGEEYCGWVIKSAVEGLQWQKDPAVLKMIFIAGNEPFTQGSVDYRVAVKAAVEKGIIVNTIHCGGVEEGIGGKWKDGADLGEGRYLVINQDQKVVHIEAPQDKEITRLGFELNKTYLGYGKLGKEAKERQVLQDQNAVGQSGAINAQRQAAKSSANYDTSSWDLVDGLAKGKCKLEDLKEEDLPEEVRKLDKKDRMAFIESKSKEREKLQGEIKKLSSDAEKFRAEELKKRAKTGEDTLDAVMVKTVRELATKKGYQFE